MPEEVTELGQVIRRQFHDEGGFLAHEQCLSQKQTVKECNHDAHYIDGEHQVAGSLAEERRTEQRVYWESCAAAHERHQEQGQEALTLIFESTRSHKRRNGAAETHDHRDKSLSRKTEEPHEPIRDKCRAGHVARIFQERETQEHKEDDRDERRYRLDTGAEAVREERHDKSRSVNRFQKLREAVHEYASDQDVEEVDKRGAHRHGKPENEIHRHQEQRDTENTVQENLVELVGTRALVRVVANHLRHDVARIGVARIRKCEFHFFAKVFFNLVVRNRNTQAVCNFQNAGAVFQILYRSPARSGPEFLCHGLKRPGNIGNQLLENFGMLHRLRERKFVTGMEQLVQIIHETFATLRRDCGKTDGGHTQDFFEFLQVNMHATLCGNVHHVHGEHHRHTLFHELAREEQVAFQVRRI